ncbi:hypothetical protein ADUPG1_014142, partial [Aduncisulcus paluster]
MGESGSSHSGVNNIVVPSESFLYLSSTSLEDGLQLHKKGKTVQLGSEAIEFTGVFSQSEQKNLLHHLSTSTSNSLFSGLSSVLLFNGSSYSHILPSSDSSETFFQLFFNALYARGALGDKHQIGISVFTIEEGSTGVHLIKDLLDPWSAPSMPDSPQILTVGSPNSYAAAHLLTLACTGFSFDQALFIRVN